MYTIYKYMYAFLCFCSCCSFGYAEYKLYYVHIKIDKTYNITKKKYYACLKDDNAHAIVCI